MVAAVKADVDKDPEASKPVTEPVLAARPPLTNVVRVTSLPITTELAAEPKRTTPFVAPVPASRIKSPPLEPE